MLPEQEKHCVPASSVSSTITKPLFALNALDNRCWVMDSTIPEKLLNFSQGSWTSTHQEVILCKGNVHEIFFQQVKEGKTPNSPDQAVWVQALASCPTANIYFSWIHFHIATWCWMLKLTCRADLYFYNNLETSFSALLKNTNTSNRWINYLLFYKGTFMTRKVK